MGADGSDTRPGAAADPQTCGSGSNAEPERIGLTDTDTAPGQSPRTRTSETGRFTTRFPTLANANARRMRHVTAPFMIVQDDPGPLP